MKMKIVSARGEIPQVDDEAMVHIAFRPSNTDIMALVSQNPKMKAVHIPSSYMKTISRTTKMFLQMNGIDLIEGDVWGHRKDLYEYSEVPQSVYEALHEYKAMDLSEEEIVEKMVARTGLGKDMIKFILKNSNN